MCVDGHFGSSVDSGRGEGRNASKGSADTPQLMMLYPIPPPPGFAFHVVEVMSSPRYHLKRETFTATTKSTNV